MGNGPTDTCLVRLMCDGAPITPLVPITENETVTFTLSIDENGKIPTLAGISSQVKE